MMKPKSRIRPIVKKEFRQIVRDKRTLGILLFLPSFMLVMFGYALNFDVKHIKLAVCDYDRSADSRKFVESFVESGYFDYRYYLSGENEIDPLLDEGKAAVAIVIPPDFSETMARGESATVQAIIDGTNATSAPAIVGYVTAVTRGFSEEILLKSMLRAGVSHYTPPIDFRPRIWFNPELRSAKFLIPGLIGFILMVTAVVSTSLSIVREKERGTMEQITVSPVKPLELILGKTIPYIAISVVATFVILLVGYVLFDVTVKGSYLLLLLVTLIFLIGCLGLGLLISTVSSSQQVAFTLATMITVLPSFVLSGFIFPIRNMPVFVQVITYLVPARYFMAALRAIILKGVGITAFWEQIALMIAFAALTIGISARRLKAQLYLPQSRIPKHSNPGGGGS
jgi:ABC-2 type transport system permease protein